MKEVFVVEHGGVEHNERGYLKMKKHPTLETLKSGDWVRLKDATQFPTFKMACDSYHDSGISGLGVVYRTHAFNDASFTGGEWLWECKGTI